MLHLEQRVPIFNVKILLFHIFMALPHISNNNYSARMLLVYLTLL